ncbi:MAG TPA: TRAP transporter large permease subunit [Gammaproteobacteria bacterium]|nr:TRAP transporter large permease subunit [Gammaproteobacteria bacterium]
MEWLALAMFLTLCLVLLAGFPVAFTLGGTALAFALLGWSLDGFDAAFLGATPNRLYGIMTNGTLIAVPLFVFMGVMLERSRIAENLLDTMAMLFGPLRGGLGISVTVVGMLLAASTGIVGATVVTMGLLSLPTMLRRGYDPAVSAGTICASGTLGQIIPPSIVLVLLGDVLSSAYQQAQLEQGIFAPETVSVGDLFVGALIPGLLLVALYIGWLVLVAWRRPEALPAIPASERNIGLRALLRRALLVLLPPLSLIVAVLGSIMMGAATPTEAASVGAVGAMVLTWFTDERHARRFWAGYRFLFFPGVVLWLLSLAGWPAGVAPVQVFMALLIAALAMMGVTFVRVGRHARLTVAVLREVAQSTTRVTAMVFIIFIGAALFSLVFRGFGGDDLIRDFLSNMPGGVVTAVILVMLIMFLLGFILDFIEITFVVVPIVAPILLAMGLDPVWLGIMIAINLQTSFLTPPFGFALFYLRGVAPPEVTTAQIYRGVMPFIAIQVLALILLALWPQLATWLPEQVYNS